MADETPIAWLALEKGTPIHTADGQQLGKVSTVVADEEKDIFSGVTFRPGLLEAERFIPAELIDQMTEKAVYLTISAADADRLQSYEG